MKHPHQRPDQELADDLRGSHRVAEVAFTELYGRYSQRTYAFLLRMTGDSAASQDLLQEVFLKFYSAAREGLLVTNPSSFLLMSARNLCLNWLRDRRAVSSLEEFDFEVTVEEEFERNDLLRLINLALELLDFDDREAFVLKFYQGYSYEQMSQLTGRTQDSLRNHVWRAKQRIRSTLKPYRTDLVKF